MSTGKQLAWIAAGYALAVGGGIAVVGVHGLLMADDGAPASSGMAAFGDMILFLLFAGFLGLVPTWFLLKLSIATAPRGLLTVLLAVAALGPPSWLALTHVAPADGPGLSEPGDALFGGLIAIGAIARIVAGPVLLTIETAVYFLIPRRVARALLVAAMLMDVVPLGLFALHLATALRG